MLMMPSTMAAKIAQPKAFFGAFPYLATASAFGIIFISPYSFCMAIVSPASEINVHSLPEYITTSPTRIYYPMKASAAAAAIPKIGKMLEPLPVSDFVKFCFVSGNLSAVSSTSAVYCSSIAAASWARFSMAFL